MENDPVNHDRISKNTFREFLQQYRIGDYGKEFFTDYFSKI
jgi:hypothetical protein